MTTEINWRHNCLTTGPHDGNPETIWSLPLLQAVKMFGSEGLKELVVARIYNDAMQMVEHGNEPRMPEAWAKRTAALAEERFATTLISKVDEIEGYYESPGWQFEVQGAIMRVQTNKLNPGYKPLHGHDTVNMLCRIIGVGSSMKAAQEGTDGSR